MEMNNLKNLITEISDRVQKFCIREEEIFHVIDLADRRKALDYNSNEYADARGELLGFLSSLGDQKLQEMMCLMDFGRNIEYNGFDCGTAENLSLRWIQGISAISGAETRCSILRESCRWANGCAKRGGRLVHNRMISSGFCFSNLTLIKHKIMTKKQRHGRRSGR